MKKNECAIVRDLMPPVLDRVASRESLEFVENHILTCEECRKQYEEMKADLPEEIRAEYEEEQGKYKEVLRSVRKTRLRRRILALVLAAVLCFAAVIGGRFAYDRLFVEPSVIVSPNDYPVMLSRLKDGSVVVTADIHKLHFNRVSTSETVEEDGKRILYLYYLAAPIRSSDPDAGWKQQKEEMNHLSGETNYSEIHTGLPGHSILIWKEGDPIPAAMTGPCTANWRKHRKLSRNGSNTPHCFRSGPQPGRFFHSLLPSGLSFRINLRTININGPQPGGSVGKWKTKTAN